MSVTDNRAACLRFHDEALSKGNLDAIDEVIDPDVVHHSAFPGQPPGRAGVRQSVLALRDAFPDITLRPVDSVAEGDKVWIRFNVTGTHEGEFMGITPTGRSFEMQEFFAARVHNGRIVEMWSLQDRLSFMQQLGVIPTQFL